MSFSDFSFSGITAKIQNFLKIRVGHKDSTVMTAKSNFKINQKQKADNITNIILLGDSVQQALAGFSPNNLSQLKEENAKRLDDRISEIPPEYLKKAETHEIDDAFQKLRFISESTLVDLFAELIAKAADKRYSNQVFPRYQQILSAISPEDAKLLKFIYMKKYIIQSKISDLPVLQKKEVYKDLPPESLINTSLEGIPFLRIRTIIDSEIKTYEIRHHIFTDLNKIDHICHSDYDVFSTQINNLESLGLLSVSTESHFAIPYDHLENHPYISDLKTNNPKTEATKGVIELTDLGKSFLKIVLKSNE